MIYHEEPKDFKPWFEIVSCFLEHEGEFLILHRLPEKSEGNTWGVPAGKIDEGEVPHEAMSREMNEETGIVIPHGEFDYFKKIYVRYPNNKDFVYHMFAHKLTNRAAVSIASTEHQDYKWISPTDALGENTNLMQDLDECIKMFYNI